MGRIKNIFTNLAPVIICLALLAAALYIKPRPVGRTIPPPVVERRDQFYGIAMPAQNTIWAVGNNAKVIRSDDGGKSWMIQATPATETLQDIAAWDGSRAVAVGDEGVVIVTSDGGKSWRQVQIPLSRVANKLMNVVISPDGSAWAVGEMSALLVSRNDGLTWERVIPEEDVAWNGITFIDAKTGWVVGEFGRMLNTTDGGKAWKKLESPVKKSLMSVAFRDHLNGVAVGLEGLIIQTSDGGRTWVRSPQVTSEHLFDVAVNGDSWRVVGDRGTIVMKDTSHSNWKARRLAENDLSWHTKVIFRSGVAFMSGSNLGMFKDGKWILFH